MIAALVFLLCVTPFGLALTRPSVTNRRLAAFRIAEMIGAPLILAGAAVHIAWLAWQPSAITLEAIYVACAAWIFIATELATVLTDPRIAPIGRSFLSLSRRLRMRLSAEAVVWRLASQRGGLHARQPLEIGDALARIARRRRYSSEVLRMFTIFVVEEIVHADSVDLATVSSIDHYAALLTEDLMFHAEYVLGSYPVHIAT